MATIIEEPVDRTLMADLAVDDHELERRKEWLQFTERDVSLVADLNELADSYKDAVIESLYEHFMSNAETREFFRNPATLERVKEQQKAYFIRLTSGDYGMDYVLDRLRIGEVHGQIGLDVKWYLGAYNFYMRAVGARIFDAYKDDPERAVTAYFALKKLVFLDIGLAIETYINQRERTIRQQQAAIRELSTPLLQVRDKLLILAIIGAIDGQRARQLTEQLLQSIRSRRAKLVVIDITGVPAVDSRVANHLVQTVEAARLMVATAIVTGLSAEVAQTRVTIGVDLAKLNTVGDLQGGIEVAERLLGHRLVGIGDSGAADGFTDGRG